MEDNRIAYLDPDSEEDHYQPAETLTSITSEAPSSFILKIDDYAALSYSLSKHGIDSYISGIFQAGRHNWRLCLYPDGDKKRGGEGYVSLYLVFVDDDKDPSLNWEVNVYYKLFVCDQIRNKYMSIRGLNRKVACFHNGETKHGLVKLLPLDLLQDESKGFLRKNTCIFGAEVFVIRNRGAHHHCLSVHRPPTFSSTISWTVSNFSKLKKEHYYSEILQSPDGKKWKYQIFPRGDRLNRGWLSVYLHSVDSGNSGMGFGLEKFKSWFRSEKDQGTNTSTVKPFPLYGGSCACFTFLVFDHLNGNHYEQVATHHFGPNWTSSTPIKFSKLMPLPDLTDPSKGFLADDELMLESLHYVYCSVQID